MKKISMLLILFGVMFLTLGEYLEKENRVNAHETSVSQIYTKAKKLMIVAHPDDEILWGGSHLLDDHYLVVCITCGQNLKRVHEFKKVMSITSDDYIMLNYPDLVGKKKKGVKRKKSEWKKEKYKLEQELSKIIMAKKWEVVVTHNPDGEYGHIHHQMTSKLVTKITPKDRLYYFTKYYPKTKLSKQNLVKIDDRMINKKIEVLNVYTSQQKVINNLGHMIPYENFVSYSSWQNNDIK